MALQKKTPVRVQRYNEKKKFRMDTDQVVIAPHTGNT